LLSRAGSGTSLVSPRVTRNQSSWREMDSMRYTRNATLSLLLAILGALTLVAGSAGGAPPPLGGGEGGLLGGAGGGGEGRGSVTASSLAHGGVFQISETLRITGSGSIAVPAAAGGNSLSLTITGDLIMDVPTVTGGGRITGDVTTATGIGAKITVETTGSIDL